mmetsp:Transcript_57587/g.128426  ORF Transcript_57587/g.128426 Transcript_57587/m.128426 type:complete len:316 (+) Transcript_57587:71-1018(+)
MTSSVITRKRAFDDLDEEARQKWGMEEYVALQKPDGSGLSFTEKTALMVAYERRLESERPADQRLFNDWLASLLCAEELGDVGKRVSDCMAYGLKTIFDPKGEIGLGYEGHIQYSAARTCLINDHLTLWLEGHTDTERLKQVVNLGAGLDTRAFWLEALKNADLYVEVDMKPLCDWKTQLLAKVDAAPLCRRHVISMNFAEESTKDLPTHGVDFSADTTVTCWLLEGLVMYLKKEEAEQLFLEVSQLSSPGSYLILNFMKNSPAAEPDLAQEVLLAQGWEREAIVYFGEEGFNYGRYPLGHAPNTVFGFSFYARK